MRKRKRKENANWKQAGFTVEASMLMPFLCFLLAVLLQAILYLHDASVFVSVAYEAAQKGAEMKECSQKVKESYAEETAIELLKERRLACSVYEVTAKAAGGKVQVTIRGKSIFLKSMSLEVEKEAACVNTVDYLRNIKKIKNLWEKLD